MSEHNFKSHPGLAAVLSFVFNGLGQIYNGQISKGLLIIFISAVSMLVFLLGSVVIAGWLLGKIASLKLLLLGFALFGVGLSFICVLGIYSIIDAYKVAQRK